MGRFHAEDLLIGLAAKKSRLQPDLLNARL